MLFLKLQSDIIAPVTGFKQYIAPPFLAWLFVKLQSEILASLPDRYIDPPSFADVIFPFIKFKFSIVTFSPITLNIRDEEEASIV